MNTSHVRPEFRTHKLNAIGFARAKKIAEIFDYALTGLEGCIAPGRELAIVKTKLEEAAFFAKKGMAILPENQEDANTVDESTVTNASN